MTEPTVSFKPSIRRVVGGSPDVQVAPDLVDVVGASIKLPNGSRRSREGWICEVIASNNAEKRVRHSEWIEGCTNREAWEKATSLATLLSLREDLRPEIEYGARIVKDPRLMLGKGGGNYEVMRALDAYDCYTVAWEGKAYKSDPEVVAFRESNHGTGSQRGNRSDATRKRLSPWMRKPSKVTRDWLHTLARAFPELPWADELR